MAIRTRFMVTLSSLFLGLVAVYWVGHFYWLPQLLKPALQSSQKTVEPIEPAHRLQRLLPQAAMAPIAYQATPEPARVERFRVLSEKIQTEFQRLQSAIASDETAGLKVSQAREHWREAAALAEAAFNNDAPSEGLSAFSRGIERGMNRLKEVETSHGTPSAESKTVDAAYTRIATFMGSVYAIAAVSIIVLGSKLARSVLLPLDQLTLAVRQFGRGNLSHRIEIPNRDELGMLASVMNDMAAKLAKHRAELTERAIRDPLTGLYNHGEFYRQLKEALQHHQRSATSLGLIILDVDKFKAINDESGHLQGDEIMRAVTERILAHVREGDQVSRYGGDEFAILLSHTQEAEARAIAERIRAAVGREPFPVSQGEAIPITVSLGLALYPKDADNEEGLLSAADEALYGAKRSGRNRLGHRSDS